MSATMPAAKAVSAVLAPQSLRHLPPTPVSITPAPVASEGACSSSRQIAAAAPVAAEADTRYPAAIAGPAERQRASRRRSRLLPERPAWQNGHSQSMTRVLGLKVGRIVLDAGHGGHDTGTDRTQRPATKRIWCLDVAKRLGALIETRMGAEVVYTRSDDTFISLERRTEIANEQKADLFLSIHANSSPAQHTSSGVETYYLNFTTSKAAMEVAARENARLSKTVHELKDVLQKIALQDKVEESREFAAEGAAGALLSLGRGTTAGPGSRAFRKAPFVVLIGASMPSVLAEIGFVSNPRDEALMKKPEFRQRIAEGLYQGLAKYASTLSQLRSRAKIESGLSRCVTADTTPVGQSF